MKKAFIFLICSILLFTGSRVPRVFTEEITPDISELCIMDADSVKKLFGVWDGSSWTTPPMLRYDDFSGLSTVCNYVKAHNYIRAKEALKKYYLNRELKYDSGEAILQPSVQTQMFTQRIIGNQTAETFTTFENDSKSEKTKVGFELTSKQAISSSYMLLDGDKNGSKTIISSRENSSQAPYIEVCWTDSAGESKVTKIPCKADTYLEYGKTAPAGAETTMTVFEKDAPYGPETARAYLNFDESLFPKDAASVSSVTLYVYASLIGTSRTKQLVLFEAPLMTDMQENTAVWSSITVGTFNFKDAPFDWSKPENTEYEWINSLARLGQVGNMVRAYKGGNGEIYAFSALYYITVMSAYQAPGYPRSLDTAWRTPNVLSALFGLFDSEYMTPDVFCTIVKYCGDMGNYLKNVEPSSIPNQRHAIQTGFYRLVCYLPEIFAEADITAAEDALKQTYTSALLNSDGSYKEGTTGYIAGVLEEMTEVLKMAQSGGNNNPGFTAYIKTQVDKLARYYADLSQPNGFMTPFGDGGRASVRTLLLQIAEVTGNQELEWFGSGFKSGKEPDYTSVMYPVKKMAIMRSGWLRKGFFAAMNAICGGNHSHPDDLNMDVTALGRALIVDPGNGGGYNPLSPAAYVRTSTLAHNTVEVDNTAQSTDSTVETSLSFLSNNLFDYAIGTTEANENVSHKRRVLFLRDNYWIVTDVLTPSDTDSHTYKQAWHPDVYNNLELDGESKKAVTRFSSGANIGIVPVSEANIAAVKGKSYMRTRSQENILSDYVYYEFSGKGKRSLTTMLYPSEGSLENISASTLALSDNAPQGTTAAAKLSLDNDKSAVYYFSDESSPQERSFGGYTFGGEMLYIEKDGNLNPVKLCLKNASSVKGEDNITLLQTDNNMEDIAVEWSQKRIDIYSSNDISSEEIRVYAPDAGEIYLNGTQMLFTQNGVYADINCDKIKLETAVGESSASAVSPSVTIIFPIEYKGKVRNASLEIEDNTTVTGPKDWNGEIAFNARLVKNELTVNVGDKNIPLSFDKEITVNIPVYLPDGATYRSGSSMGELGDNNVYAERKGNLTIVKSLISGELKFVNAGLEVTDETRVDCREDTYIRRNSSGIDMNYSDRTTLDVSSAEWTKANCRASFIKFKYGDGAGENIADIQTADKIMLTLSFSAANAQAGTLFAYGLENGYVKDNKVFDAKNWSADTLIGSTAQSLYGVGFFENNPNTAEIYGNEKAESVVTIDVTDYVKSQSDGVFAFKLAAKSASDEEIDRWSFYSIDASCAESFKPHLTLYMPERDYSNNELTLTSAEDAQTRYASSYLDTNYCESEQLGMYSAPPQNANCRMSFVRFTTQEDISNADAVYLNLNIKSVANNVSGGKINAFGLVDDAEIDGVKYNFKTDWSASTITGNIAKAKKLAVYGQNCVSAEITAAAQKGDIISIDVTDYVRSQKDGIYAFKLHSESNDSNLLNIAAYSCETELGPSLLVIKDAAVYDINADIDSLSVPETLSGDISLPSEGTNGSKFSWISRNNALSINNGSGIAVREEHDVIGSVTVKAEKNERKISKTFVTSVLGTKEGLAPKGINILSADNKRHIDAYSYVKDVTETTRLVVSRNSNNGKITGISALDSCENSGSFIRFSHTDESGDKIKVFLIDLKTMKPILVKAENQ